MTIEMEKITPLRISELFPPRDAETHLGEVGEMIQNGLVRNEELKRVFYTSRGIEWRFTGFDGKPYVLLLMPDDPNIRLSHMLESD